MQIFRTIVLLFVCYLFANNAFATTYVIQQEIGLDYELPPQNPQVFINFMFTPVKATCTIISECMDNALEVTMLRRGGVLNGAKIAQGDVIELFLKDGDKFVFTVDSGAKIQLLNKGNELIRANCSAA